MRITRIKLMLKTTLSVVAIVLVAAVGQENLLEDTQFALLSENDSPWISESNNGAQLTASKFILPDGTPAARLNVQAVGAEIWHAQFFQQGLKLQAGKNYVAQVTLSTAEAFDPANPPKVDLTILQAKEPWTTVAVRSCEVSADAKLFTLKFTPSADFDDVRFTLSTGTNLTDSIVRNPSLVME